MRVARSVAKSLDFMVANHAKLAGSRPEDLQDACDDVLVALEKDPASILGPICEQLTRTAKRSKRAPYIAVAHWLHEKANSSFEKFVVDEIREFAGGAGNKRRVMGCSVLLRSLALVGLAKATVESLCSIVANFESAQASLFEMEVFNGALFACQVTASVGRDLTRCVTKFAEWMKEGKPIAGVSADELVRVLGKGVSDCDVSPLIPLMRTDIPPSSEKCQSAWGKIAGKPFESRMNWIEFGLAIGRCDEARLRSEIASLANEKGQFSSIITVALSAADDTIQAIARALFRFGIHGKESASFDPASLSQVLEQSDDLTDIAITFLSEMALANAKECVPQLFPLLQSDKASARKNSLELLSRILKGRIDMSVRKMIANSLLPMVADEAISVRVDIPKLFVSLSPDFIVPPLIKMLGDKNEKKRSTASESINQIMKTTEDPALLLKTVLDCALGLSSQAPDSPASIEAITPEERKRDTERALNLVEKWATESAGKMMINPNPILDRLWADPKNSVIVSFIAKSSRLYNSNQLLAALITRLSRPIDESKSEEDAMFERLAPLLVLKSQPEEFYMQREVVASPIFDFLYVPDEPVQQLRRVRGEIMGRFDPSFVIPKITEHGLLTKLSLFVVCMLGNFHPPPIPEVCDVYEEKFYELEQELFFPPLCDAFFFADRRRAVSFAIKQNGTHRGLLLLCSAFQKFQESDARQFFNSGGLDQLLKMKFEEEEAQLAVNALFFITYKSVQISLDPHWETLFEIASHYFDKTNPEVRFAALKLVGALISNTDADRHPGRISRIEHIVAVASEDYAHPEIQKFGADLAKLMKPDMPEDRPLITEISHT